MNVIVVGGGSPNKFGNDLVNRLRGEGHDVYILSHRDNGTNDLKQVVADFSNFDDVVDKFKTLLNKLPNLDLFVYNSNCANYPVTEDDLKSNALVNEKKWQQTLSVHVIIPHALAIEALKKMSLNSKMIFMTSGLATDYKRTEWTNAVGYATGKAGQTHLMLGLAHNNDKGVIVTSILPHLQYHNREIYETIFERAYNYIVNLSVDQNGKIENIL